MPCVSPVGAPRLAVPTYPGRRPPVSVPFSGRSEHAGRRLAPKPRPKLTKAQKKAVKWARKHPEQAQQPLVTGGRWYTPTPATPTVALDLETQLGDFVGQPATGETIVQLARAVRLYAANAANHYNNARWYTPTTAWVTATNATDNYTTPVTWGTNAATITVTTTNATTGTWTIPMNEWADWNAEWVQAACNHAKNAYFKEDAWTQWQGRGHSNDLWYNPNDQLQKERLRRERLLEQEAERARLRQRQVAEEAERQRRWEAERPAREAAAAAARQKQETALKRSYELLFRHMTDEQKNMLETENRFLVTSQSRRIYEIRRGTHQNIYRLDDQGRAVEQLCCYIPGVPEGDCMLGQMLHLMVNEEDFRRTANKWELHDMSPVDRRLPLVGRDAPNQTGRILRPEPAPVIVPPHQQLVAAPQQRAA